ncbi:hypothetical protein NH340_JMT03797 [Sarcoptes scabiei]|uniref:Delta-aminolevulinic acid dehydratase n=1 Tax=Sarcoptes scabiei TaxID=52283 RepID=A0A132A0D6_SARSC|nr:delta-aminolevulinic acid dehydratase-like protein [Sarcoptes scabiei]UXI17854.1 hypothetical protein NH340_JMT03797 [Sarcoptes scabiei]
MALSKEQNSLPNGDHFDSYFCDDLHSSQSHPITRYWQQKSTITFSPKDFVLPIFLMMDESANESIENFPNIKRMGSKTLIDFLSPLISEFSLQSILLFPCLKNTSVKKIDDAFDVEQNPLIKGIDLIKKKFPQLLIIVDVCLCTFTEHGHCCVFRETNGQIDNEKSVEILSRLAVQYARCGADIIAPSDMMDSRVFHIRKQLNLNGFENVAILSYAAKFESCFYGPFRNAANSWPKFGDRKQYQLPMGSKGMALRGAERDIRQGADMVMVKPAMAYLDIVQSISNNHPNIPIAVYQVSGEYSMIKIASENGIFPLQKIVFETLASFKRAGASIIITYFTPEILKWIKSEMF